jgi:hypothetical protein
MVYLLKMGGSFHGYGTNNQRVYGEFMWFNRINMVQYGHQRCTKNVIQDDLTMNNDEFLVI